VTAELAVYLRALAEAGAATPEGRTILALLDASWLIEAGADPITTLARVAAVDLPDPYAQRVAECLAELHAPQGPAPAQVLQVAELPAPVPSRDGAEVKHDR
jgi:hypothetical protein